MKQTGLIDYTILVTRLANAGDVKPYQVWETIKPAQKHQAMHFVEQHRAKFAQEFSGVSSQDLCVSGVFLEVVKNNLGLQSKMALDMIGQTIDGLAVQKSSSDLSSSLVSNRSPIADPLDGQRLYQQASEQAHTYYVATTGLDTNSGDEANPFKTIQHAVDTAQAGDIVLIEGGTYYERIINVRNSGTVEKPIRISNVPGEQVVIDHGLQISGWSNVNGSIYQTTSIVQNSANDNPQNTQRVVVGDRALVRVNNQQDLTEGTFWVDPTTGNISVWAFGGVNPANESAVLINFTNDYQSGIRLFDTANHVVLNGLVDRGQK